VGPAAPLFGQEFYGNVRDVLTEGGIVVSQAENPFYEPAAQRALLANLRAVFPVLGLYNYHNLTYPGGLWSFSFASLGSRPLADFSSHRVGAAEFDLKYYNADTHAAAFALPEFQRREVAEYLTEL
jgi:spermidine synthase